MTQTLIDILMEESMSLGNRLLMENKDEISLLLNGMREFLDDSEVTDPSVRYCCMLQLFQAMVDSLFVSIMTFQEEADLDE